MPIVRTRLAMMRWLFAISTIFLALTAFSDTSKALEGEWQAHPEVRARLISAVEGTGARTSLPIGLHVQLAPGWKTYWRSPGDAGLPPKLDWLASSNVASADMLWPAPHRFTALGLETIGYSDEVIFPIDVRLQKPGEALDLKTGVDILVCEEVCIPYHFDLALNIPAGPDTPDTEAPLIGDYVATVPDNGQNGLRIVRAAALDDMALEVGAQSDSGFVSPDIFVESTPPLAFGAPQIEYQEDNKQIKAHIPLSQRLEGDPPLSGLPVTLTLVDKGKGTELKVTLQSSQSAPSLIIMLGLAVLGGLILNLMPCVLPVLSLKLLSVAGYGGAERRSVRIGFLASAAGIMTSFLVLAGAAIAVKMAGATVGWGIQFQQPLFLTFLIVVVTLFAANLWGLFEIPLPHVLANMGGHRRHSSLAGHFATGAFATLLATPCSAPFLGTAVGFALARGPLDILAVFLALGLGLALPYVLIAIFPQMASGLPKPGRWMVILRHVLGVALALTGLWLLTVLAGVATDRIAVILALLVLGLPGLLWVRKSLQSRFMRTIVGLCSIGLGFVIFLAGLEADTIADALSPQMMCVSYADPNKAGECGIFVPNQNQTFDAGWQAFDEAAIPQLVATGRTVFVDVTADWCLTCQANKRLILKREDITSQLLNENVVAMQADWTRPNEAISAYLNRFGRYGIPFNIVYGPGAPEGIVLPELLTPESVREALKKAASP